VDPPVTTSVKAGLHALNRLYKPFWFYHDTGWTGG
jgi:hypothetical protein